MRVNAVAVLALVFIGIAARPAAAQVPPLSQEVMDETTPPGNDDFDAATVVSALPFDDSIDTRGATGAADDPLCDGQCGTVWYRYTPEGDNAIGVTTWGSTYDTRIFVYTGMRGALEWVSELSNASYRLAVSAGTTYHFMILSPTFDLTGGRLRFSVTDGPPLSLALGLDPPAVMDKRSGIITVRGAITCSKPAQVFVSVRLERFLAQRYLRAGRVMALACVAHLPFELDIQTYDASRFGDYYPPGPYVATAHIDGFDTSRGEPAAASIADSPILVRGAP